MLNNEARERRGTTKINNSHYWNINYV